MVVRTQGIEFLWKVESQFARVPPRSSARLEKFDASFPTATMLASRSAALSALRLYSTATPPPKPSVKLIAEIRKVTEVSITKAREALTATNNDVQAALKWLEDDLIASGAKKAEKLADRTTKQGLVGYSLLSKGLGQGKNGTRAAMVELNCETDFVGRNARFDALVADIAYTAAFLTEPEGPGDFFRPIPVERLQDAPLLSHTREQPESQTTVGGAIHDSIARFGEKISLGRAVAVVQNPLAPGLGLRVTSYAHGAVSDPSHGHVASLALLAFKSPTLGELIAQKAFQEDLAKLERALARQIVGFPTTTLAPAEGTEDEYALLEQQFMLYSGSEGQTVKQVLDRWAVERGLVQEDGQSGLRVVDFVKWTVGEAEA